MRQRVFQLGMRRKMTAHQMRRASAHPPARRTGLPCSDYLGMIRQTKVIIAAKSDERTPINEAMRRLRAARGVKGSRQAGGSSII